MEITDTFYARTRAEWRSWLADHHEDRSEIWLVTYRKAVGRPSVAYNDAVEEALCFGWIDSIRKGLGEERLAQRFTPRRPGSGYSQINLERVARLLGEGRVLPQVAATLGEVRADTFEISDDILQALRADADAWHHWHRFSPSYRRIRAAYVDSGRERGDAEYMKRLDHLVRKTAAGKQFGYGIEPYY